MSTTMTASSTPQSTHHEPPAYSKSSLPTYSKHASDVRPTTSTFITPQSPSDTTADVSLSLLSLPPAAELEAIAASLELPSATASPTAQSPFSPAISLHSLPSVRDFAHPIDSPEHTTPSPTIEPSATRRPGPRRAYPGSLALPASTMSTNGDELPAYTARRKVYKSEDEYLAALASWAEDKLYSDAPKDSKGRSVGLTGFYGTMSSEDYVAREERRKGGPNTGKAKAGMSTSTSGAQRRESNSTGAGSSPVEDSQRKEPIRRVRPIDKSASSGEEARSSSPGQDQSGRRSSIAQWMRKKTNSANSGS